MSQYLKPDSALGYIEDSAQIECLKFNNLRHTILGCMLGDFDEVGVYVVSPDIVSELIAMEKYLVQTYDNIELCKSALKLDKQISFMVTFEGNKVTLSLVEKINYEANFLLNSGTYSNINEYVLDSVETSGEVNRNVIYQRWNIRTTPSTVIDIFNCDDSVLQKYFGIVNRFKYLLETNKILLETEEKLEEIEAGYSNQIFEILSHYPKLEEEVIKTIKETLEDKKTAISVKKPFFAKTFNELLENSIEKSLNSLTDEQKKEFETEKRNAVLNLNIKRADAVDIGHREQQTNVEIAPNVVVLKTNSNEQSKTIEELGQDFVSVHKKVAEKTANAESVETDLFRRTILAVGEKKGNDVKLPNEIEKTEQDSEVDKLIKNARRYGFETLIGIEPEKKAEKAEEKKEEKVETKKDELKKVKKAEVERGSSNTKKQTPQNKKPSATQSKTGTKSQQSGVGTDSDLPKVKDSYGRTYVGLGETDNNKTQASVDIVGETVRKSTLDLLNAVRDGVSAENSSIITHARQQVASSYSIRNRRSVVTETHVVEDENINTAE